MAATAHAAPAYADGGSSASKQANRELPSSVSLDAELLQVSLNTGRYSFEQLTLDEAEIPEGFASSFLFDYRARRANLHLSGYSNELAIACDLRRKQLRIRLAGGDTRAFYLRLDSDVALKGKPEIDARLIVAIAGHQMALDLPRVRVNAKWSKGELQTEFLFPLLQGDF